jgi:manganese/iron transport system ATP-binding protein
MLDTAPAIDPGTRTPATSTASATHAAEVRGLSVTRDGREALENVSLALLPARTLAVVGPNGGGKTTLLRAMLGLLPSRGSVLLAGLPAKEALRRGDLVGFVPQNPQVPVALPLTARQAVRLAVSGRAGFLRRPPAADLAWADEMLSRIAGDEADELAGTPVTKLSGGQLQQVFLARALANRPRLVLLDEPTVGLDRPAVARLTRLLGELKRDRGLATLIATHDHLTAMALADEMIYLDTTIRYHGPADALPAHLDARLCHHDHAGQSLTAGEAAG